MALEYRRCNRTTDRVVMLSCPLCGYVFADHEPRPPHFLMNHGPDDLGSTSGGEPA